MAEIIWDSELGPEWPSDWPDTTIHAQFVAVTGDGADSNRLPDIAPSGNGEVIFTPSLRTVRYVGADGPYVVSLKQYRAVVDSEGYLCTPDQYGQPGERGIVLPSTDAEVLEPRGEDDNAFTWRVDFDIPSVNIRSDHISVPVDGPYNLVDLLSPERAAGVVHIIDRVSARDAIEAAQEATAARDLVLPARDETLAARDETLAHGITVDTSVGTRVFVGDTMIYGDTGWRALVAWDTTGVPHVGQFPEGISARPGSSGFFGGDIRVRRINESVLLQYSSVQIDAVRVDIPAPIAFTASNTRTSLSVPTIFRSSRWYDILSGYADIRVGQIRLIYPDEAVGETSTSETSNFISWTTASDWPTSLPGVPA